MLIADDEADARNLIAVALDSTTLSLQFAASGDEAIAKCREDMPDLAILDVQMPGSTGLEVCSWIKSHSCRALVPVLLLTCQSEVHDRVQGLDCGADDYIVKPFAFAELAARVRAFVRIKALTDELRATQELLADKERQLIAAQVGGAAAHELGQPLTSIMLHCELLQSLPIQEDQFLTTAATLSKECARIRETLACLSKVDQYRTREYVGNDAILDLKNSSTKASE
ncbi:MAG: response regulator [Bdellovibrionales bacterium]|nr:response regulator [Bdellovibrionales bacterium]